VDVFVERRDLPLTDGYGLTEAAAACCALHRARWQGSYVAESGSRICHYRAPDAESVRLAFRTAGIRVDAIWAGTVHGNIRPSTEYLLLDLQLPPPLPADTPGTLERAEAEWLSPVGLRLALAFVSADRGRVICLCELPASGVTRPNRWPAGADRLWRCRPIAPDC
jgi:hypothetical protein